MRAAAAQGEESDCSRADVDDPSSSSSRARRLKLQLFQALSRRQNQERQQARDAWSQYWRALQQFVVAELSRNEFERAVDTLLGPELVELHNALVVALLVQAAAEAPTV